MRPFVCGWVSQLMRESVRRALPFGHDTDYSFSPITFKLHMGVVDDEKRNPIDFGPGSNVKVTFSTLCIKPCGHDTDCSFSPITFKPFL